MARMLSVLLVLLSAAVVTNADDVSGLAVAKYADARARLMTELGAVADVKSRADTIVRQLVQRNPDWSWRWRFVEQFADRLAGKPGFEQTLMLLGSDNLNVRNGAFRTLLYASELESHGRGVAAINTRVTVPGLGPTDVDILLSDGTIIEAKSSRLLQDTPQLRAQLNKLGTLADERAALVDTQLNGRRVLAARGQVSGSARELARRNGFEVYERMPSRSLPVSLTETEAAQLRTSARSLSRGLSARAGGAGGGAVLLIVVLDGGTTLYLQLTGQLDGPAAAERYGEVAAKAFTTGGAVCTAVLLGANPIGVTVIVTGAVVYIVTEVVIGALRSYYHSGTLTVADINAASPEHLAYRGDTRDAVPPGYELRSGIEAALPDRLAGPTAEYKTVADR